MSEHSTCWQCGDDVDHATGHDCPMDDNETTTPEPARCMIFKGER